MMSDDRPGSAYLGPGEARTRERVRKHWRQFGLAAVLGGVIGLSVSLLDLGDGNLFAGDWAALNLPPAAALVLAILLIAGFLVLPLYGFTIIDDYKREHNLVGFTGGCLAVLSGFPVWAVLHAGGFVPAPHAFGIYALGFVGMFGSFLYARWRL